MCISISCSYYAAQMLYKYSLNTLRVKRAVGLVTCPRVFLPLAWYLLEHSSAPSVSLNRNKWQRFKTLGSSFISAMWRPSNVLKCFGVTRNDKARVVSSTGGECVYPRIHLTRSMHLQEYIDLFWEGSKCLWTMEGIWLERAVTAPLAALWQRKLEWYLKSRCIFSECWGYYWRNKTLGFKKKWL